MLSKVAPSGRGLKACFVPLSSCGVSELSVYVGATELSKSDTLALISGAESCPATVLWQ